jgi:signal transduction histidine kinase/HAMP domain-containing protein
MARRLRLSLRTKLALALGAAALVPLILVSAFGIRVALGRLERNLMVQTRQTAHIAMNLLLRQVQRIAAETSHLAADPELHELLALDPALVGHFLESYSESTEAGLLEVVLPNRRVVARVTPRDPARFERIRCTPDNPVLLRALDYERHLTLTRVGGQLVIQTAAPIVDSMFVLRGAVLTTWPLDDRMADYIKGVVRADITFINGAIPVASTFVDATGQRLRGVTPPRLIAERVLGGAIEEVVQPVAGHEQAVAYAPLQTVQGERIGMMAVAVSREGFMRAQASATRSLILGAVVSFALALLFGYLAGKRISTPLHRLHRSTQEIAAGNLEHEVSVETEDEIGDLAVAFQTMTSALREHRERLAARMREILTLHQIGRAVSSVLSLDQVFRLIVNEVTAVLGAERGVLLLVGPGGLQPRAAIGLPEVASGGAEDPTLVPAAWRQLAEAVIEQHTATVGRMLLAVPLETRERVVGALVVARRDGAGEFGEADLRLVVTFADQASTAIENARLYDEMEAEVRKRTGELVAANERLGQTIKELKETQAQLIHSERMAGLGLLVAGVAHEINTPAGAIQGSAQSLAGTLQRLVERLRWFVGSGLPPEEAGRLLKAMLVASDSVTRTRLLPPAEMRRRARELAIVLEAQGVVDAQHLAKRLLESGAAEMAESVGRLAEQVSPELLVGIVEDLAFLERSSLTIQTAIGAIVRIVGALKSYAHTDQESIVDVDITEGLETTLTILHNQLRYGITVSRLYAPLPKVPVYVDELNQVWTNLIHNSIQAMGGKGEIEIETLRRDELIGVRISDTGPGIAQDVLPRIFEPFFTTKPAGEGSGLGLGIAQRIVEKHGGRIEVDSRPGRTSFTVWLPVAGPAAERRRESDAARS